MKNILLLLILLIGISIISFSQNKKVGLIIDNDKIIKENVSNSTISFFIDNNEVSNTFVTKIKKFLGVENVDIESYGNNKSLYRLITVSSFSINNLNQLFTELGVNEVCIKDKCTDVKYLVISNPDEMPIIMEYEKAGISGTLDHYNSLIEQLKYKIYFYQTDEISLVNGLKTGYFAHKDKQLQRLLNEKQALLNE